MGPRGNRVLGYHPETKDWSWVFAAWSLFLGLHSQCLGPTRIPCEIHKRAMHSKNGLVLDYLACSPSNHQGEQWSKMKDQRVYLSGRESGKEKWKMTGGLLRRGRLLLQLEQGSPEL